MYVFTLDELLTMHAMWALRDSNENFIIIFQKCIQSFERKNERNILFYEEQ